MPEDGGVVKTPADGADVRAKAERGGTTRRALLVAAAMFPFARSAHAWVPPGDFLLGKMAERRKNVKTLSVKGIRTFVGRSFEGGKQDVAETLASNVADSAYRLERKTPKGVFLEVSNGEKRVSVTEGKTSAVEADPRPLERLLFTGAPKDELGRAAQAFGIRLDVTGLGRAGGHIAWILGAKDGDTTSPQLWIDKDKSLPLELRDPRSKRVVRFDGWGEPGGAGVVPTRVTILRGEDIVELLKVEETRLNPKLAADLFKPESPVIATPTPAPSPEPGGTTAPGATATPKPAGKPTPKPTPKPTKPAPR